MGLFNGYMKEGPGVTKNAPEKHRFFLFFELFGRKFSKLIQLNMLLFICLLPMAIGLIFSFKINDVIISDIGMLASNQLFIPTGDIIGIALYFVSLFISGPAIAGFTYIIRNFQREEHAWLMSDFKDNFKSNFKQATILGFIDTVVYYSLYVAFEFYRVGFAQLNPGMAQMTPLLIAVIVVAAIVYTWMHYYLYVMMVTFDLKLKDMFRNALLFAIGKLPLNIFITLVCGAIIIASILYNMLIGIIATFLITLSLIGYIVIFSVYPTIDNYLIKPVTASDDDDDDDIPDFNDDREE